jgi:hypothetical protein
MLETPGMTVKDTRRTPNRLPLPWQINSLRVHPLACQVEVNGPARHRLIRYLEKVWTLTRRIRRPSASIFHFHL